MGQFESGKWIVLLSIYFFLFFLVSMGIVALETIAGSSSTLNVTDPGYAAIGGEFGTSAGCFGTSEKMFLGSVYCSDLGFGEDQTRCEEIEGCVYQNSSELFGFWYVAAKCVDHVNLTYYGYTESSPNGRFCSAAPGLDSESLCTTLGCEWSESTRTSPLSATPSTNSIWSVVGFMAGFNVDIGGIPAGYYYIVSMLFFWLPFLMLLWAIYMALPFLH